MGSCQQFWPQSAISGAQIALRSSWLWLQQMQITAPLPMDVDCGWYRGYASMRHSDILNMVWDLSYLMLLRACRAETMSRPRVSNIVINLAYLPELFITAPLHNTDEAHMDDFEWMFSDY